MCKFSRSLANIFTLTIHYNGHFPVLASMTENMNTHGVSYANNLYKF